jgi:prevent-host-death family protein
MYIVYTIRTAQRILPQLIKAAARGEEIIIARGNVPVAKLVPILRLQKRKPGTLKGKLKIKPGAFDPLNASELRALGFE